MSYIKKQMEDAELFKNYTLQGVLDKLDVIECFEAPGQELRVGEILEKQKVLYTSLGIDPPSSLWVDGTPGYLSQHLNFT